MGGATRTRPTRPVPAYPPVDNSPLSAWCVRSVDGPTLPRGADELVSHNAQTSQGVCFSADDYSVSEGSWK